MMASPGATWRLGLRIAAAFLIVAVLFQFVAWDEALALLARIDPVTLAGALGLFGCGQILSTVRWRFALAQIMAAPPPLTVLLRLYLIGMFCNLAMPATLGGDVIRAELAQGATRGRGNAYVSVLADRLIGVLAIVAIAALALVAALFLPAVVVPPTVGATLGALALLTLGVAVLVRRSVGALLPWRLARYAVALRRLRRAPGFLWTSLGLALLVQVVAVIVPIGLLAHALGFDVPFALHFVLVPLAVLATLIPISINGLGVRESAFLLLYGEAGVAPEPAFAVGLAWTLVLTAYGLLGGVCLLRPPAPTRATSVARRG